MPPFTGIVRVRFGDLEGLSMSATNARAVRFHDLEDEKPLPIAREVTAKPEVLKPFVSAQEAARFIGISRRFLIELARRGLTGAYPIGTGEVRKTRCHYRYKEGWSSPATAGER